MMCMKVDLPEPDGPVTARNSPRSTSRLTPRSAFTSTSPTTYVLTRFLTEITASIERLEASSASAAAAERVARPGSCGRDLSRGAETNDACDDVRIFLEISAE